jgi:hypothetical protein
MGEGGGLCYGFFLKNILMLNKKKTFLQKKARKKYSDARFSCRL